MNERIYIVIIVFLLLIVLGLTYYTIVLKLRKRLDSAAAPNDAEIIHSSQHLPILIQSLNKLKLDVERINQDILRIVYERTDHWLPHLHSIQEHYENVREDLQALVQQYPAASAVANNQRN